MLQKKLLFLTLNTFSSTGGIEKVCRVAGKALCEMMEENGEGFDFFAMNDRPDQAIEKYVPAVCFHGFSGNKIKFVAGAVRTGAKCHTVILSHINLLLIGFAIKVLSPKTKIILIAHGIEVWKPLPFWKTAMLKKIDFILPVS